MSSKELWLTTMWPSVRSWLQAPPATVVELGCGSLGGFVPALTADGYDVVGIDPAAPEGPDYRQAEFEHAELPPRPDAVIASLSLHHVAEPGAVLDKVAGALAAGGIVIVVEWNWEAFDERTARWCLQQQVRPDGWMRRRLDAWSDSGEPWEPAFRGWAREHGLNSAGTLVAELDRRFERVLYRTGPYMFAELAGTSASDEQRAIDTGEIQPLRIDYVGRSTWHTHDSDPAHL